MAKQTLTYAEAREQFPVTNNMYSPLENLEEYPTLSNSFATMTEGTFTNPLREQWAQTNQPRSRITPAVKMFQGKPNQKQERAKRQRTNSKNKEEIPNSSNKQHDHRSEANEEPAKGTALINPFKVTEKERWEYIQQQEKQKAEKAAGQSINEAMMQFYTEFLSHLEDSEELKRKFKNCTQKHFNLAKNVVGNTK